MNGDGVLRGVNNVEEVAGLDIVSALSGVVEVVCLRHCEVMLARSGAGLSRTRSFTVVLNVDRLPGSENSDGVLADSDRFRENVFRLDTGERRRSAGGISDSESVSGELRERGLRMVEYGQDLISCVGNGRSDLQVINTSNRCRSCGRVGNACFRVAKQGAYR